MDSQDGLLKRTCKMTTNTTNYLMTNYPMTNKPIIKMKYLLAIIISILAISSLANTLTVKQDGTGDYTIIQGAVNATVDGDTVLIWPGTYYENIDLLGKGITLASLMLTTGDESYKHSTVIDGNNTGSCIKVMYSNEDAVIYALTLQHGSGTYYNHPAFHDGGGILIVEASCSVINCVISDNWVNNSGGGILCSYDAYLSLSGTSIFNNHAYSRGGGILFSDDAIVEFDSVNLCSIYSNYSSEGCDLFKANYNNLELFLDTCTVALPENYFVLSVDNFGYPVYDITFNILNHVITHVDADLYVNPQTGDNGNSGLTAHEPLKTIAYAYSSIHVDSLVKNTIHLANGIYSDSANNEKFPLNIRPFIEIVGESREHTILDGMNKSMIIKGNVQISNYSFSDMTMYRGGYVYPNNPFVVPGQGGFALLYIQNDNITFDSILFKNGHGYVYMGNFHFEASNNVKISNCEFRDNIGAKAVRMGAVAGDTAIFSNCIFKDNLADYQQEEQSGGSLLIFGFNTPTIVQGCLFTGNNEYNVSTVGGSIGHTDYFINCTFSGNTLLEQKRSIHIFDASLNMYNCILYNEGSSVPISLSWGDAIDTVLLSIYNSLIENGEESIYVKPGPATLHYDETNIEGDPLFYGGAEFPYNLSDYSPCIDAGTLDLPDFIELPEFDLAGNLRVYNGAIDMGAYEWDPTVGVHEHKPFVEEKEKLLKAAPNPFSRSTTITVTFKVRANIKLEVYNNYGQRVRVLADGLTYPGTSQIIWYSDDDTGHVLPAGVYYMVMFEDGKEVESLKMVKGAF